MSVVDSLSRALIGACGVEYETPEAALSVLDWMEQSAVGVCVAQSTAGYYIMLSLHALGLAMVVGIISVLNLRLLGVLRGISIQATASLVRLAWIGLIVNAVSGVALFLSEANKAFYSNSFRIKILLMVIGIVSTIVLNRTVYQPAAQTNAAVSTTARVQAYASLCIWASVIIVGRLMSYFSEIDVPR